MIIWCSVIEFSDASWKLLLYEERDSPRNGEKYFSVFLAFGTLGGYLHLLNQTRVKLLLVQQRENQRQCTSGEEVFFAHCSGRAEETLDSGSLGPGGKTIT